MRYKLVPIQGLFLKIVGILQSTQSRFIVSRLDSFGSLQDIHLIQMHVNWIAEAIEMQLHTSLNVAGTVVNASAVAGAVQCGSASIFAVSMLLLQQSPQSITMVDT